jgi:hypothetical protein
MKPARKEKPDFRAVLILTCVCSGCPALTLRKRLLCPIAIQNERVLISIGMSAPSCLTKMGIILSVSQYEAMAFPSMHPLELVVTFQPAKGGTLQSQYRLQCAVVLNIGLPRTYAVLCSERNPHGV